MIKGIWTLFIRCGVWKMDNLRKKATITIFLVSEAEAISNKEIEKQIKKESFIPFLAEFESVQIEEVKSSYEMLRGHGISQRVARNVVEFYS